MDPDPYHGWAPGIDHVPVPPYPGYHHPCTTTRGPASVRHHRVSTGWDGSPGFFWLQWPTLNTDLSKTTTFFDSKTDLSKNVIFCKNPYLILLCFAKMVIFDVFAENGQFWHFSGHHWDTTGFHCFLGVRFSHGKVRKSVKYIYFLRIYPFLALFPEMSPTNLILRKWPLFWLKTVNFDTFWLSLWVWIGVLTLLAVLSYRCCQLWCQWCQSVKFVKSPGDLIGILVKKCKIH